MLKSCIPPILFQSAPSVGRATCGLPILMLENEISIRALRGEGDYKAFTITFKELYFNPRPPWGGRQTWKKSEEILKLFQSAPSVGRATFPSSSGKSSASISIRALRGEGDAVDIVIDDGTEVFQSTPSVGRATPPEKLRFLRTTIFQSTPSVGRATIHTQPSCSSAPFQSTPSVGRATIIPRPFLKLLCISIHALRGEGDSGQDADGYEKNTISIHALRGEGDFIFYRTHRRKLVISIHALRGEGDRARTSLQRQPSISIHALRGEGDTKWRKSTPAR